MLDEQVNETLSNDSWISNQEDYRISKVPTTVNTNLIHEPDTDMDVPLKLHTESTISSSGYRCWTAIGGIGVYRRRTVSGKTGDRANKTVTLSNQGYRSRGRPIKSHEQEPFLSVNNLSPEKIQEQINMEKIRANSSKEKRAKTPLINTNQPYSFWANYQLPKASPYSSPIPPRSGSRSGARTPNSMIFVSPTQSLKKTNHHVKSPFKQSVMRPDLYEDRCHTPSQDMRERTAIATYQMGKVLGKERTEQERKRRGKLLKGQLKPLKPVSVVGPTIQQCRGIIADTRTYNEPPSRTLARRKELIQTIPNVHEYLYDRPRTVESIHRTSEASSIDENKEATKDCVESDRGLDTERSEVETVSDVVLAPPSSTVTNYKSTEPSFNTSTPRMLVLDVQSGIKGKSNITQFSKDHTQLTATVSTNLDVLSEKSVSSLFTEKQKMSSTIANIRPRTAGSGSISLSERGRVSNRPSTAGDKSKSVRFADDSSEESSAKGLKDFRGSEGMDKNKSMKQRDPQKEDVIKNEIKTSGKVSCKPPGDDVFMKKDDEDEDESDQRNENQNNHNSNGTSRITVNKNNLNNRDDQDDKQKSGRGRQHVQFISEEKSSDSGYEHLENSSNSSVNEMFDFHNAPCIGSDSREDLLSPTRKDKMPKRARFLKSSDGINMQNILSASLVNHCVGIDCKARCRSHNPSKSTIIRFYSPQHKERDSKHTVDQKFIVGPSSAECTFNNTDTFRIYVRNEDYLGLLCIYRMKCMDISEVCMKFSCSFDLARKYSASKEKPHSKQLRPRSMKNHLHFEKLGQRNDDEQVSLQRRDDIYNLMHPRSKLSLTTDNEYSGGLTEASKEENIYNLMKPDLSHRSVSAVSSQAGDSEENKESINEKSLLKTVCDILPSVEKVQHVKEAGIKKKRLSTLVSRKMERKCLGFLFGFTAVFNKKDDAKLNFHHSVSHCDVTSALITPSYRDHLVNVC